MKQEKLWNLILVAVLVLQLLAEGMTAAIVFRLNMLPAAYFLALIGILFLLFALTGLVMFLHRKEKTVGVARRIISCVLAILIVSGCGVLCKVSTDVYKTMHSITAPPTPSVTRSIFVRAGDSAQALADAANYTFAAVENYDHNGTNQAIEVIEQTLNQTIPVAYFTTVTEMIDALYSENVDAIILNGALVRMLEELENYADFSQKTKLLYDVPIEGWTVPSETTDPTVPSESEPEETVPQNIKPFVFYIAGSDSYDDYLPTLTRYDVNILVAVNPQTKQVLLLNTPRDYFVENPAGGGARDKLTHCGNFGIKCSIQALQKLYGLQVDYYGRINFSGIKTLIDAVGGVTVTSDVSFVGIEKTQFVKGENHLNGAQALEFARERKHLPNGDHDRGKNQMKVINALIQKMTSGTTLIANYAQILNGLSGMFETSMPMDDISKLVKMQLTDMASWNVQSYAVSGKGGYEVTYSWPGQELWVMYVDEAHVAYASGLVKRVLAGDTLTEEDLSKKR